MVRATSANSRRQAGRHPRSARVCTHSFMCVEWGAGSSSELAVRALCTLGHTLLSLEKEGRRKTNSRNDNGNNKLPCHVIIAGVDRAVVEEGRHCSLLQLRGVWAFSARPLVASPVIGSDNYPLTPPPTFPTPHPHPSLAVTTSRVSKVNNTSIVASSSAKITDPRQMTTLLMLSFRVFSFLLPEAFGAAEKRQVGTGSGSVWH